ncbi:hypothetical protein P8X24_05615 [Pyrococcus kukulkanii]|uniref:hypothetical protein n=1 Tax=Pyrococcus kukulkanii TaxID=1609559 RepID=UPI003568A0C5
MKYSLITWLVFLGFVIKLPHPWVPILISTLALTSTTLGIVATMGLALYLILTGITNFLGVAIIALLLLTLEIREMEKKRAPFNHYLSAVSAIGSSMVFYTIVYAFYLIKVPLEVTWIAVAFAFLLYAFIRRALLHG